MPWALFALVPFEAAIVWISLDIRRKVTASSRLMETKVDETAGKMVDTVANAMELGVALLRQQSLPPGDDPKK